MRRMWYGEPEIAPAEPPEPQLVRVAIWPPQARTGLATMATKLMLSRADLSPAYPDPSGYEYASTVSEPGWMPHIEKLPAIGVNPPSATTCGSTGIAVCSDDPLQPVTPRHGSAL